MTNITPEERDAFNKEIKPLLAKHNISLAAEAFIHEGKILARPVITREAAASDAPASLKTTPHDKKKD